MCLNQVLTVNTQVKNFRCYSEFCNFSCPHITPKPGQKGKLFWLSGPPGAGKSTTCQLMARDKGFIYYEADSTMQLINPFVDINVDNPTIASLTSRPLKVLLQSKHLREPPKEYGFNFFREFHKTQQKYC